SRHQVDFKIEQFLVEEQIEGWMAELIVGVRRHEQFGLVLLIGAGGTLVEMIDDVATLLLPTNRAAIARALSKLRVAKLLWEFRDRRGGDVESLLQTVLSVAEFAEANRHRLLELDVNPLFVLPPGLGTVAVDGMMLVADTC